MTHLFTTIGRAALVALGLAVAPAAFAQSTASCPTGMAPQWSGDGSSSASYVCALTCTGGQVATVSGNQVSCTGGGGGPVAPSGCTLGRSPANGGPSATNVTLTLSCSSGTLPINVAWQGGNAPGNCPTSMDALTKTCTVPSVSQTTTWTVAQFSNDQGNGSGNSNKSATFTYNAGGGGGADFSSCPAGTITLDPGYGTYQSSTGTVLYPSAGQHVSFAMWVPSSGYSTGKKKGDWATYGAGGGWYYSISEVACDYAGTYAVRTISSFSGNPTPYPLAGYTPNGTVNFQYRVTGNLTPGKMYYLNMYAPNGAGIIGTLPEVKLE